MRYIIRETTKNPKTGNFLLSGQILKRTGKKGKVITGIVQETGEVAEIHENCLLWIVPRKKRGFQGYKRVYRIS